MANLVHQEYKVYNYLLQDESLPNSHSIEKVILQFKFLHPFMKDCLKINLVTTQGIIKTPKERRILINIFQHKFNYTTS